MNVRFRGLGKSTVMAVLLLGVFAMTGYSHHSLGKHWARTSNPFTLKYGDNLVGSAWDNVLSTASTGWSASSVVDTTPVFPGGATKGKCQPTKGRVEVCSVRLGGSVLGKNQMWTSGEHITQATILVNDYLLNNPSFSATWSQPKWRQYVVCHEMGHTLGLDHADEDSLNTNLGTCLDYTHEPLPTDGSPINLQPYPHDFVELESIYLHLDTVNTVFNAVSFSKTSPAAVSAGDDIDASDPSEWGQVVRRSRNGQEVQYERDLGNGNKLLTSVLYAN